MNPILCAFILAGVLALPVGVHAQKATGRQAQPPRPSLPFAIEESVWQTLEASEMYRNAPRPRALRLRTEYESSEEYTGSESRTLRPAVPQIHTNEWEITPLGEKCTAKKFKSGANAYVCGSIFLGSFNGGEPFNPLKSLGPLSGSLYPPRIGAEQRVQFERVSTRMGPKFDIRTTSHCRITGRMKANQLSSRLTGTAWIVPCREETTTGGRGEPRVSESEDYLIEDLGIMLSLIGVLSEEKKQYVMPAPGFQTVRVSDGDWGSRATSTYRSHEWTVGAAGPQSVAAPLSVAVLLSARADPNYVGEYKNGKKSGQGSYTLANGNKYVGEFRDDQFNGQGTLTSPAGEVYYVGAWKDGMRNGQGTDTEIPGVKYVGEHRSGWRNGQGTLTLPSGNQYVGAWKYGKQDGQGAFTFADGSNHVGGYKDGKESGQGTFTWPSGAKHVGEYQDGKRSGQGTFTWPSGEKFVGEFRDDKFNGQGTRTSPSGWKYVGEFKDDKYSGHGTYTFADGDRHVGEFKDNNFNGQGIVYNAKGTDQCAGTWENDKLVKEAPGCWAVQRRADAALAEARRQADEARQARADAEDAEEAAEKRREKRERARQRAQDDDDTPPATFASLLAETTRDLVSFNRELNAQTNAVIGAAMDAKRRKDEAASKRAEEQRLERVAEIERRNEGVRARNVEIARENKQLLEDSRRRQEAASARQAEHAQAAQQAKVVQQRAQDDEQRRKEAKAQIAAQQRASNTLNQQMQQQANQQAYDSAQAARQPKAMQPDVIASNSAAGGNTKEKPKKTLKNPGESANLCLTATSLGTEKRGSKDTNQIEITNNCGQDVFVLYCGDLWATSRRCGSSPKSYYTHSSNLGPNKSTDFNVLANGSYQYAGCMGGISFGNDGEYRDEGSGSISCLPR